MEIHQLRYFIAVVDEGSFSRAAAREHVAQPSLSQQIQKLEAEMGERLFDRLPRSVVVTEAGKCLLEYARRILAEIADARRCVDELKGEVAGRLAVGAIPTIAPYVLPALIGKFQHRYPKVTLEIFEDTTERLVRRLEDGELDIVLLHLRRNPRFGTSFVRQGAAFDLAAERTSAREKEKDKIERSRIAKVSSLTRNALPLGAGLSVPGCASYSPHIGCNRRSARYHCPDGGGRNGSVARAANDDSDRAHDWMRRFAVCGAGSHARAQFGAQSSPRSE
jgi:DNA-binding transcriptional LysR family regulator